MGSFRLPIAIGPSAVTAGPLSWVLERSQEWSTTRLQVWLSPYGQLVRCHVADMLPLGFVCLDARFRGPDRATQSVPCQRWPLCLLTPTTQGPPSQDLPTNSQTHLSHILDIDHRDTLIDGRHKGTNWHHSRTARRTPQHTQIPHLTSACPANLRCILQLKSSCGEHGPRPVPPYERPVR